MSDADHPWLDDARARLYAERAHDRLAHGLLLHGPAGIGKAGLAVSLADALLCERPQRQGAACGACRGCRLTAADGRPHPDYQALCPADDKKSISVDQVRQLAEFVHLKSQYAGYRVAVITPADAMTHAAANALLKTLEEPPAGAVLILVADRLSRLPATVLSRCRQVALRPPTATVAAKWLAGQGVEDPQLLLALVGGAPLRALDYRDLGLVDAWDGLLADLLQSAGAVRAAARFDKLPLELFLLSLQLMLRQILRLGAGGECEPLGKEREQGLRRLSEGVDWVQAHRFHDLLLQARQRQDHPLNPQLVREELLERWNRLMRPRRLKG
ncbi:DNA polymerase III subunit delta' [Alkalilimnicola sp. S0819]|uniref:DNA polymerase III subunit delta' n=1 Tax=Alkalilimnicola sp. S0819 TaxID=2613922 RepID=UPI001261BC41|nr:DNA polymerase III subunit delta' [Alkalilimnicola sp. S0819]KAB7627611.1 DNA polymerase III subunit delta' [Alkalilimnicola sp. S0819]MPQ15773.1 DNA polymerase III subunit delta' [Alkalilimnicola sp. S0819]